MLFFFTQTKTAGFRPPSPLANLEAALYAILLETDNSGVLPASFPVPSSSRWQETLQAMMPNGNQVRNTGRQWQTRCTALEQPVGGRQRRAVGGATQVHT